MNNGEDLTTLDPHQRYEELCALAAAGQVTPTEAIELNEHLRGCPECRESVRDFAFLCVQVLPAALKYQGELPAGMTERFIARARSEGIRISDHMKAAIVAEGKDGPPRNAWKTAFWAEFAACLFIGGILLWVVKPASKTPPASVMIKGAPPTAGPGSSEKSPAGPQSAVKSGVAPDIQALVAQLRSTEARLATVTEELKQHQRELDRLHKSSSKTTAANRSARVLLGTRNLHVINTFSRDANGQPRREFGRLFYVEGKRLEFYAFDLDNPKVPHANTAFYVWGETRNTAQGNGRIVPLGRLSFDRAQNSCWVLIVSDPKALVDLKYVFVTTESTERPVLEPTGAKILLTPLDSPLK